MIPTTLRLAVVCDAVVAHVAQLLLDDGLWCGEGGQVRSDMPGGPGRQGDGRCQGHQHRQQCGLVDQERDLRPPGQCGGVPLASTVVDCSPSRRVGGPSGCCCRRPWKRPRVGCKARRRVLGWTGFAARSLAGRDCSRAVALVQAQDAEEEWEPDFVGHPVQGRCGQALHESAPGDVGDAAGDAMAHLLGVACRSRWLARCVHPAASDGV